MFTGVNFEQAIDYWKKGREVIVLDRNSQNVSGGYDNFPFEELFRNVEEKRLQDLLHELEFAEGENEKRRAGTKLQQSRRNRRRQKDEMMRLELVVQFFDDPTPKSTINKMRQLLGKQRKQEEFLDGERHYNPRVRE